jgi:hypothetical protein
MAAFANCNLQTIPACLPKIQLSHRSEPACATKQVASVLRSSTLPLINWHLPSWSTSQISLQSFLDTKMFHAYQIVKSTLNMKQHDSKSLYSVSFSLQVQHWSPNWRKVPELHWPSYIYCPYYFNGIFLEKNQPGEFDLLHMPLFKILAATRTAQPGQRSHCTEQ